MYLKFLADAVLKYCDTSVVLVFIKLQALLDDWQTMHRCITLVDFQLDAQNSYLFIYNTFIKIFYMFRALPCSSSEGLHRNCIYMQPLVSSLSAGDCLVHRCTGQSPAESDDTRG